MINSGDKRLENKCFLATNTLIDNSFEKCVCVSSQMCPELVDSEFILAYSMVEYKPVQGKGGNECALTMSMFIIILCVVVVCYRMTSKYRTAFDSY